MKFGRSQSALQLLSNSAVKRLIGLLRLMASLRLMLLLGAVVLTPPATAQEMPKSITPPEVTMEPNGVNILTGKAMVERPKISIPAAPRLSFSKASDIVMYVTGEQSEQTRLGKFSVHYGGDRSNTFEDLDVATRISNSDSSLSASLATGGTTFQLEKDGVGYQFYHKEYHYSDPAKLIRHSENYASKLVYPDGEILSIQYYDYNGVLMPVETTPPFNNPRNPGSWPQGGTNRVAKITSSTGYFSEVKYWDSLPDGWGRIKSVAIYASGQPTIALAKLEYSADSTQVTDLGGRVWNCSVDCGNAVVSPWRASDSISLPTESVAAVNIQPVPGNSFLAQSINRDGAVSTYQYLGLKVQTGVGTIASYMYDSVVVANPDGSSRTYTFDNMDWGQYAADRYRMNYVKSLADELGRVTNYTYEPYQKTHRLIGVTSPEGNVTNFLYGGLSTITRMTTRAKPGSGLPDLIEEFTYPSASTCAGANCWLPIMHRDAKGNQTDFVYNANGQLTERTDPADANGVRRKTYIEYLTTNGISRKVVERVCGLGTTCGTNQEYRTEYDYWGNTMLPSAVRRVDPVQGITLQTTYSYDTAGRVLVVDGPLAGTDDASYNRYDVFGRKTWEIGPLGANGKRPAKRLTYRNSDDRVIAAEVGYVVAPTDTNVVVATRTDMTYDSRRNPVREALSAGGTTYQVSDKSYDLRNRPICQTQRMNSALFGSLPSDACTPAVAGNQGPDRITRTTYDVAGHVLQVREAVGTDVESAEATYTYTLNGKKAQVIDAEGNRAEFRYDGHDRQVRWVFPAIARPAAYNDSTPAAAVASAGALNEGDYEAYAYDGNGNRTSLRKRDGSTIGFAFDYLNRVTVKTVPERAGLGTGHTRDVYFGYDLRGLQTYARFDSANGEGLASAYDGFGRISTNTQTLDGNSRALTYQYDANGNRTELTWMDGAKTGFGYDAAGRLTKVYEGPVAANVILEGFTYDDIGRLDVQSGRYGAVSDFGYDPVGRLSALSHDFAGSTQDLGFSFAHNPASQIVTLTRSNDAYAWTAHVNADRSYVTNGLGQYTTAGPAVFCHDANGNLTADGSWVYLYDVENRLVEKRTQTNATCASLSYAGSLQAALRYDPLGRLYEVRGPESGGAITRFLNDGDALVAEYAYDAAANTSTLLRRYVHGSDNVADDPLLWYEGASIGPARWLRRDWQGSIAAVADASNAVVAINRYDEYGIPQGTNQGRFQYTGQAWIGELGMYYYKARIYSPTLGRFLQTDPIGYEDQVNLYAYVANDPVNFIDDTGEQSRPPRAYVSPGTYRANAEVTAARRSLENVVPGYRPRPSISSATPSAMAGGNQLAAIRADYQALSVIGFGPFNNQSRAGEGFGNPNRSVGRIQTAFEGVTFQRTSSPGTYNFNGGTGGLQAAESFAQSLGGTQTGSTGTGSIYSLSGLPSGVSGNVATYQSGNGYARATVTLTTTATETGSRIQSRVTNTFKVRFDD